MKNHNRKESVVVEIYQVDLRTTQVNSFAQYLLRNVDSALIRTTPVVRNVPDCLFFVNLTERDNPTGGNRFAIHRNCLIFEMPLGTGIRQGWPVVLNRGDVDLGDRAVRIRLEGDTKADGF